MKKIAFFFPCLILVTQVFSQQLPSGTCDVSTNTINTVFYSNTNTVYTSTAISMEWMYLCGPNTTVYDTAHPSCRVVLLNAGCKYVTNSGGCVYADFIYVKNTATLIVKANANPGSFRIFYEPGSTVINQTNGLGTQTISCANLIFPTPNCSPSGINLLEHENTNLVFYPNPTGQYINIRRLGENNSPTKICIYNNLGQLIKEENIIFENNLTSINTELIVNGTYTLRLFTPNGAISTRKLFISR